MGITIKKTTKNGAVRKEVISDFKVSFGGGYGAGFWWKIHCIGKGKNGLRAEVEFQMNEKDREKFIEEFDKKVAEFKKYIKDRK